MQKSDEPVYERDFDVDAYLKDYYGYVFEPFITQLNALFKDGKFSGQRILDYGCGPNIQMSIAPSRWYDELYMCEYLQSNRSEITKWMDQDPGAFDWTGYFQKYASLEEKEKSELEARIRQKFKGVYACDIRSEPPVEGVEGQFDLVLCTFCVFVASKDEKEYEENLKRVASLIKPGGHLMIMEALGGKTYKVGDTLFPVLPVTEEILRKCCGAAGMEVIHFYKEPYVEAEDEKVTDTDCWYIAMAQKQ